VALLAACGSGSDQNDAAAPHDSPPLLACAPRNGTNITFRPLQQLSDAALLATSPPNDGRLFVIERQGRIRIYENEQLRADPFLSITNVPDFAAGGEQGLLGLAFSPHYAWNREFYVFYTTSDANVVARYRSSTTDYNKAEPTGEVILSIPDFAGNHNGGMIEFGNDDGYLYISTGDGGGGGDPCRNGQQLKREGTCPGGNTPKEPLLGKILRIDVTRTENGKPYAIPMDNPYADGVMGEPEIYIVGLRNPWRFSFDRQTGDMYIGDVGQNEWEELTILAPSQQRGANLGWSRYEGNEVYPNYPADPTGITMPQLVKSQANVGPSDGWDSIIGGQVYRGTCFPDLVGNYYFTDITQSVLMSGRYDMGAFTATQVADAPNQPASIHADARGELFLTTVGGGVYQIEAGP
jgi:glucose/arabinose dehydrogenase